MDLRPKTINYTEENIGTRLIDLGLREDFYEFDPKGKESKGKNMNGTVSN